MCATVYATVAQSVEQLIRNQQVAGSSPASSSKIPYIVVLVLIDPICGIYFLEFFKVFRAF